MGLGAVSAGAAVAGAAVSAYGTVQQGKAASRQAGLEARQAQIAQIQANEKADQIERSQVPLALSQQQQGMARRGLFDLEEVAIRSGAALEGRQLADRRDALQAEAKRTQTEGQAAMAQHSAQLRSGLATLAAQRAGHGSSVGPSAMALANRVNREGRAQIGLEEAGYAAKSSAAMTGAAQAEAQRGALMVDTVRKIATLDQERYGNELSIWRMGVEAGDLAREAAINRLYGQQSALVSAEASRRRTDSLMAGGIGAFGSALQGVGAVAKIYSDPSSTTKA
ncbi:hypothetical protein [Azospirillum rugosum]|uniref:Uncharacterized protein n=1 Tax=Azospirillum rugosum TaxID=416170 RepID=A0ABS4SDQ6_9PROT|nr:hypothetical protein [Azospirillum rugosum]MBP2290717.1 hypothetical protein [Azospirillum rugosum]MDQ0525606.1 hypothetical protein [Azospirillum rugosum]